MTNTDLIRTAIARLRETAAKATPGPWECDEWSAVHDGTGLYLMPCTDPYEMVDMETGDAAWIALANPSIAEPLAKLIDYIDQNVPSHGKQYERLVALAAAIVGER